MKISRVGNSPFFAKSLLLAESVLQLDSTIQTIFPELRVAALCPTLYGKTKIRKAGQDGGKACWSNKCNLASKGHCARYDVVRSLLRPLGICHQQNTCAQTKTFTAPDLVAVPICLQQDLTSSTRNFFHDACLKAGIMSALYACPSLACVPYACGVLADAPPRHFHVPCAFRFAGARG